MSMIRKAAGAGLVLLFFAVGFGVRPAAAHVTPQHAELVVSTKSEITSGRLIVHRDVVSPEQAGAWATRLLTASCPATGSGAAGDAGGVSSGVVVELAWSCRVDRLDLTAMLRQAGLTQVVVEFDGTTADATTATPVVDATGAHAVPSFPWRTVLTGIALAIAVLPVGRWIMRLGRRRIGALTAGAAVLAGVLPQAAFAADTVPVQGTVFKDDDRSSGPARSRRCRRSTARRCRSRPATSRSPTTPPSRAGRAGTTSCARA